jgi:hypothetical protein
MQSLRQYSPQAFLNSGIEKVLSAIFNSLSAKVEIYRRNLVFYRPNDKKSTDYAPRSKHRYVAFTYFSFKILSSKTEDVSPYTFVICFSPQAHRESRIGFNPQPYSLNSYSTFGGTWL